MLNIVDLSFRLVDESNESIYKDKEGEIHLRDWVLEGYDEDEDEHIYAGCEEFYADEDEKDGEVKGFFGRWNIEDLAEVLRISLFYNNLAMLENSLQTLYEVNAIEEIHSAIRKGMLDVCKFYGELCFYEKFRLQIGYLFGLCGSTSYDPTMIKLANALINCDEISAKQIIADYINGKEII